MLCFHRFCSCLLDFIKGFGQFEERKGLGLWTGLVLKSPWTCRKWSCDLARQRRGGIPSEGFGFRVTLYLFGGLLLTTFFLPVGGAAHAFGQVEPSSYPWDLLGLIPFAPLLRVLFPGLMGLVLFFAAQFARDEGLQGILTLMALLLGLFVIGLNPLHSLAEFELWESAPGHRVLLFSGVVSCSTACAIAVRGDRAVGWAVAGATLLFAYLLTPTPTGTVPIAASLERFFHGGEEALHTSSLLRLGVDVGLVLMAVFTLVVEEQRRLKSQSWQKTALAAGWFSRGLLPSMLLPLVVGVASNLGSGSKGLHVVREFAILCAYMGALPLSISVVLATVFSSGRRKPSPALR